MVYARWTTEYLYFSYIWTSDSFRLDQNHGVRSVDHGVSLLLTSSATSGPVTAFDSIRIMVYARWTTEYLYFSYIWTSDGFRLDQNHGVRAVDHGVSLLLINLDQ
ncbi:hypothetical protein RRG08_002705 [Elysia crispata]|uniref:Uncharacterized protein n=1 Tax=Elysia crispata TaxID=231223 RepID=A0AAE1CMB5_9GAST|nr:hypothetical protein RRG08_002705 [Elysia crispata]